MRLWDASKESRRALVLYWLCRAKLTGGVLHGRAQQRTLSLFGWSKSMYYRNIDLMMRHGLLTKDMAGNYAMMRSEDFIALGAYKDKRGNPKQPKHKSTLKLEKSCTMKQVRSAICAKFIERRCDQIIHAITHKGAQNKVKDKYAIPFKRERARISTKQLAIHLNTSRSSAVRWKKGAGEFFRVENERLVVPSALIGSESRRILRTFTYIDARGNGIVVRPTSFVPRMPYRPIEDSLKFLYNDNHKGTTFEGALTTTTIHMLKNGKMA